MATSLFPFLLNPALALTGVIAPASKMAFYLTGTTTLASVYDANGDAISQAANGHGVVGVAADAFGRFPPIYVDNIVVYRVRLCTALGVQLGDDIDPYSALGGLAGSMLTYATRSGMASAPSAVLGAVAYLSENMRAGSFKVVSAAAYTAAIAADTYQAYFVPVTGQPALVWMRQFTGRAAFEWGGADPTGTTDSGSQINAMLANTFCNAFLLGDGIYQSAVPIGQGVTTSVSILGLGEESSMFSINGDYDAVAFTPPSSIHGLELRNFSVQNQAASAAAGAAIRLSNSVNGFVENIATVDTYDIFHGSACSLSTYRNVHGYTCINNGQTYDGGGNFNETWYDSIFSGGSGAVNGFKLFDACEKIVWYGCTFSVFVNAGVTDATVYVVDRRPSYLRFYATDFDSCQNGPKFDFAYDIRSNGCFYSCRPNDGLTIGGTKATGLFVSTNDTYFFCGKSAVVIGAYADGVILDESNTYISCGGTGANSYDTISVVNGVAQGPFRIAGGEFRIDPTVVTSPRYMIHIAAGASVEYDVGPCRGQPGTTGFMLDEAKGANRTIANMPALYPTITNGTATAGGGGTVSYPHGLAEQPASLNQIQITPLSVMAAFGDIGRATGFPDATHVTISGGAGLGYAVRCAIAGN